MKLSKLTPLFILATSIGIHTTSACDLCGCYLPPQEYVHHKPFSLFAGVSEQFTRFGTLQYDGHEVANPADQYLNSSITQVVIGSSFFDNRLSLQVNVPLIYRSYKRPEGLTIDRGHESGVGDISLLANVVVLRKEALFHKTEGGYAKDGKTALEPQLSDPDFSATINLIAGLKLPTGDASRLKEEFHEVEVEGAPESGIHGHDLALGSGSYDGIFGAQAFVRYKSVFFEADAQYALRSEGRYSYRYANDLSWSGGPGVYLFRRDRNSVGLQCVVSGETKGTDRFQGEVAEDTGLTSLYIGPRITAQLGGLSADVGLDLPVVMNNTKLQAVPDYRIRAGFTFHF